MRYSGGMLHLINHDLHISLGSVRLVPGGAVVVFGLHRVCRSRGDAPPEKDEPPSKATRLCRLKVFVPDDREPDQVSRQIDVLDRYAGRARAKVYKSIGIMIGKLWNEIPQHHRGDLTEPPAVW